MNTPLNTPLSDPALPASAKIIWLVLRRNAHAGPLGPRAIEARSGLTRHTALRGVSKLAAAAALADRGQSRPPA